MDKTIKYSKCTKCGGFVQMVMWSRMTKEAKEDFEVESEIEELDIVEIRSTEWRNVKGCNC